MGIHAANSLDRQPKNRRRARPACVAWLVFAATASLVGCVSSDEPGPDLSSCTGWRAGEPCEGTGLCFFDGVCRSATAECVDGRAVFTWDDRCAGCDEVEELTAEELDTTLFGCEPGIAPCVHPDPDGEGERTLECVLGRFRVVTPRLLPTDLLTESEADAFVGALGARVVGRVVSAQPVGIPVQHEGHDLTFDGQELELALDGGETITVRVFASLSASYETGGETVTLNLSGPQPMPTTPPVGAVFVLTHTSYQAEPSAEPFDLVGRYVAIEEDLTLSEIAMRVDEQLARW